MIKTKGIASHARADLFEKDGNKFQESIEQARALLEEWEHEDQKPFLLKLLSI